ncbi:MAG: hypothetical protein R2727_11345 [Bacteroidales bacterium]
MVASTLWKVMGEVPGQAQVPVDDDNDGLYDEDGPNDLNGNRVIERIKLYAPGEGNMRDAFRTTG